MEWVLFSLIVMVSVALVQVITKKDAGTTHTIDFARSMYTFVFLFSLPLVFFVDLNLPLPYYGVMFIGSLFNILAVVNLFRAIKYLGVGKAVPMANIELIITLFLSSLVFHETLSWVGILGIVTIFLGAYMIEMKEMDFKEHVKTMFSDPFHLYVLASALSYSLSSMVDRFLVTYMPTITGYKLSALQYVVVAHSFIFLNFWIIHFLGRRGAVRNPLRYFRSDKLILLAAFLIVVYRLSQIVAISLAPMLIYVIAIKRTSPLLSELFAFKLFKESNKKVKLLGTIIILIGAYLVLYNLA